MTEVPKIVHDRLRATCSASPVALPSHPDANMLTAFAEQALSAPEREDVVSHLAHCGDCREVIALALPAEAVVIPHPAVEADLANASTAPARTIQSPSRWLAAFGWPGLRWAALAAGVVVAGSVLLLHSPHQNTPGSPTVATVQTSPDSQNSNYTTAKDGPAPAVEEPQSRAQDKTLAPPTPAPQSKSNALMAENKLTQSPINDNTVAALKKHSSGGDRISQSHSAPRDQKSDLRSGETAPLIIPAENAPFAIGTLMARNDAPPIQKAKPPLQDLDAVSAKNDARDKAPDQARGKAKDSANEQAKTESATLATSANAPAAAGAYAARMKSSAMQLAVASTPTWAIHEGALQRSFDNGQHWQNALSADHPLSCYASRDQEVWAGGDSGTLFHSTDSGQNWTRILPSMNNQNLTANITNIELHGLAISISTNTHEVWTSADGGQTWEKRGSDTK